MAQPLILDLPLKGQWYDMIETGPKDEEYREIKPYWNKRLIGTNPGRIFKPYAYVRFRYGYTKRTMMYRITDISINYGKPEWGAPIGKLVYIIKFDKSVVYSNP
jgi:hypothetical protein